MTHISDRCRRFHELHQSGCFVMPNPWDLGSARLLASLGFPALATTSAGFAWTVGARDNHVTLEQVLAHLRAIAGGVEVPVNADFEGGFATEPAAVAANVAAVVRVVAPKPVNVLVSSDFTTVAEMAELGVRRISVGGALARTAWAGFLAAAKEIAEHGTFVGLARAARSDEIEAGFERTVTP